MPVPTVALAAARWSPGLFAALRVFSLLALVHTCSAPLQLGSAVPGNSDGDTLQYVWDLWQVKMALLDLHRSPLWTTDRIYCPSGASFLFHSLALGLGLLYLPLTATLSPSVTNSDAVFRSFVLAGFGIFLPIQHLTGSRRAALVGGFVFTFTPYHFAHLPGHWDLASIQRLALFTLCLVRSRVGSARWAPGGAGVLFALAARTSGYYGFFLAVFAPVLVIG